MLNHSSTWLSVPRSFTWAPEPEGLLQLGPSLHYVPGDRSMKLYFLGLNFRISLLLSEFQLSGVNSILARSCFQLHADVKGRVNAVLCYSPPGQAALCKAGPSHLLGGRREPPRTAGVSRSLMAPWDIMRLHAVWLLCGWERVWMRFIHCNQNPTSTGRKFKCMWNNLSKKLAKAAYFSCLTRSYAIKWLITRGTVWGVKD